MTTRVMIWAVRALHGVSLAAAMLFSVWFFITALEARFIQKLHMRHLPEELILSGGWLMTEAYIAWYAWMRFESCSFRRASIAYGVWLMFFVWFGWFMNSAPFRIYEPPPVPGYLSKEYMELMALAMIPVILMAIFPALRYYFQRRNHVKALK